MAPKKRGRESSVQGAAPKVDKALVTQKTVQVELYADPEDADLPALCAAGVQWVVCTDRKTHNAERVQVFFFPQYSKADPKGMPIWQAATRSTKVTGPNGVWEHGPVGALSDDFLQLGTVAEVQKPDAGFFNAAGLLDTTLDLTVPVPAASLEGDVLLQTTEGSGHAFRAHSQVLSLASRVLKDLLSEQREELQAAAASEQPLVLPMPSFSGSQLHMLLQVLYTHDVRALLEAWHWRGLKAMASMAHALDMTQDDILGPLERALVDLLPDISDSDLPDTLLWAHTLHFRLLEAAVAKGFAHCGGLSTDVFGDNPLAQVVQEFQSRVEVQEAQLAKGRETAKKHKSAMAEMRAAKDKCSKCKGSVRSA